MVLDLSEVLLMIVTYMSRVYYTLNSIYIKIGSGEDAIIVSLFNASMAIFCIGMIIALVLGPIISDLDEEN